MKKLLSIGLLALLAVIALASCSGNGSKAKKLLAKVPSDAQLVMVINGEEFLKQADIQIKGNDVALPASIKKIIGNATDEQKAKDFFLKSGMDIECLVLFMYQGEPYLTGYVGDNDAFRKYYEKVNETTFVKEGQVEICGKSVAMVGDKFWVGDKLDAPTVQRLASLDEKESFAATDYASTLASMDNMVEGIANLSILQMASQGSMIQLGIAAAFADARYFAFDIESAKGELEAELEILNSEFKPATTSIKLPKIDMSIVNKLKGTPGIVMAVALNKELLSQLDNIPSSQLDQGTRMMLTVLKTLDGTVAVAFTVPDTPSSNPEIYALAQCKDKEAAQQISGIVNAFGSSAGIQTAVEGNSVIISNIPSTAPKIDLEGLNNLKGEGFGLVVAQKTFASIAREYKTTAQIPFKNTVFTYGPDNKSAKMKLKCATADASATGLTALFELASITK